MNLFKENGYFTLGTGKLMHGNSKDGWDKWGEPHAQNYGPFYFDGEKVMPNPATPKPFSKIGPIDGSFGPLSAGGISNGKKMKKAGFWDGIENPLDILKKHQIDILFEAIGQSDGISKKIVEAALKNGTHVIPPNKALISKHGNNLSKLAEKNNVNLEFEASVAGGIPVLRAIKEGLATNKISKVYGILNGTSNYILSEMENSNKNFSDVLKKAQQLGYAEPGNPKLDLNGFDAFAKVRILSALAFNSKISKHKCLMEGIEKIELKDIKIANQLDLRVKLLGISELKNNQLFETCLLYTSPSPRD